MKKKELLDLIGRKTEERQKNISAFSEKIEACESAEEIRSLMTEAETFAEVSQSDIDELRSIYDSMPDEPKAEPFNVLATYGVGEKRGLDAEDAEYRSAFMDYVQTGKMSAVVEERANAVTKTTDIGAVIPNTILNKIVEKMRSYGKIWNLVTKTNHKGGVSVPISSVKPVATWQAEGTVADKQKKTVGSVVFKYYKLQIRVATTIEAATVSLPVFEQTVADNIYEAMVIALEQSIVSGTGSGQPKGIVGTTPSLAIPVVAADLKKYDKWTEIISKIPQSYRGRVTLTMTQADWDIYVVGMVDSNGQPIARVTVGLDGVPAERILGIPVVLVEDLLPAVDAAADGDVFAYFVDYKDYLVNTNMQITYRRYFDENTDEWIQKSTLIADGQLIANHSLITLTKAANK